MEYIYQLIMKNQVFKLFIKIDLLTVCIIKLKYSSIYHIMDNTVGFIRNYYDDGSLWEEYYQSGVRQVKIEDGDIEYEPIKEGICKSYYENGQIESICNFVDGKEEGEMVEYYENGTICRRYNYVHGVLNGKWEWFFDNGKILKVSNYINGKKEGEFVSYYENGQIEVICNFYKNKEEGEYKYYSDEGNLLEHSIYKNGIMARKIKIPKK